MIKVFHARETRFTGFATDAERAMYAKHVFNTTFFEQVAEVPQPSTGTLTEKLDYAFELTNTIHEYWATRVHAAGGNTFLNGKLGNRSTSAGDVMVIDDRVYVVAGVGFLLVGSAHDLPRCINGLPVIRRVGNEGQYFQTSDASWWVLTLRKGYVEIADTSATLLAALDADAKAHARS